MLSKTTLKTCLKASDVQNCNHSPHKNGKNGDQKKCDPRPPGVHSMSRVIYLSFLYQELVMQELEAQETMKMF